MKGREHSKDLGVDGRFTIRMDLREIEWKGFIWLRIQARGGGLL
jgi:hypothetical protein